MSDNYVVITSINDLTKGVRQFALKNNWEVILIGDMKSPHLDKNPFPNVTYISLDEQKRLGFQLSKILPNNHYCRKNLGYLYAIREGAKCIADTDDDNIPYDNWGEDLSEHVSNFSIINDKGVVNIYRLFSEEPVWPRGFPLTRILDENELDISIEKEAKVSIWQGLVDNDPDVDAIYRLVNNTKINFKMNGPYALSNDTYCPFNSQNTVWFPTAFIYLYLPVFVTFRFTDILRGYIAQGGIHQLESKLAFTRPTVYQERNEHNLMTDFVDELPCYLHVEEILDIIENTKLDGNPFSDIHNLYDRLFSAGIVSSDELEGVELWIQDLSKIL